MKKRVFIAVGISEGARQTAARYIENLHREFPNSHVGWARAEKLHLTLKFLGEIGDGEIAGLIDAARQTAREITNFELQIAGTGVFPTPRRARVLWLGLNDERGGMRKLAQTLEQECEKVGLARETRDFRAHLTIARLKEKRDNFLIKRHLDADFSPSPPFEASEIVIYRSELLPEGSRYSVISKVSLRNGEV